MHVGEKSIPKCVILGEIALHLHTHTGKLPTKWYILCEIRTNMRVNFHEGIDKPQADAEIWRAEPKIGKMRKPKLPISS